jgi:transposase
MWTWGLKLRKGVGSKRAAVAVGRKLALTMHATLNAGSFFDQALGTAA